jgi:hypothetical protein
MLFRMIIPTVSGCAKCSKEIASGTAHYYDSQARVRYHPECAPNHALAESRAAVSKSARADVSPRKVATQ